MEELVQWGAYVITGVIGWFVKTLWDAQTKLREDLKQLEVNLPKEYVGKADFKDMYKTVLLKLDKIETLFMGHITEAFKERTSGDNQ